jgi:uncharacterized membrane protein YdjX (TVP38/TMEM64 family)
MENVETRSVWIGRKGLFLVLAIAVFGLLLYSCSQLKNSGFLTYLEELNPWTFFTAMLLLPQVGFPVMVLYPIAGIKYGFAWGLFWAFLSIIGNLILSYWIAHLFAAPLKSFLEKRNHKIPQVPEKEQKSATILVALVPGPSYALKNYLLPLTGVPFKIYFWFCLPIHTLHAVTGIFLGETVGNTHPVKIIILVVYAVVLGIICRKAIRKLRKKTSFKLP